MAQHIGHGIVPEWPLHNSTSINAHHVCNGDEMRRADRNEVCSVPRVIQILDEAMRLTIERLGVEEALAQCAGYIVAHPRPRALDLGLATGVHAHPQLLVSQTVAKL